MHIPIIILIVFLFLFFGFIFLIFYYKKNDMKKTKEDLIKFMKTNPNMWAMSVIQNDEQILNYNHHKPFPLASTVKIIFAIAFIESIKTRKLDINEIVSTKDVDLFFLKGTDGNSHIHWKESENINSKVTLKDIAIGMMKYSSNACTDYLYYKIEKEVFNKIIKEYSLFPHTDIYSFNSAILIPSYLQVEKGIPKSKIAHTIKNMSNKEYNMLANSILDKMAKNDATKYIEKLHSVNNRKIQLEQTLKLPSSTTFNYAKLMNYLASSDSINSEDRILLNELMGNNIESLWYKGGSSISVLTSASFIKDTDGNNIAFAFFLQDKLGIEINWIRNKYNEFIKSFLTDYNFRAKVMNILKELNN